MEVIENMKKKHIINFSFYKNIFTYPKWSQDEILKESVFDLDDDLVNKAVKKRRGEVLRAKVELAVVL